jgi:predicted acylesterase/phospholipase RssA
LKSAIAPALECNTTLAIEHAVRASVADPFYFASVQAEGQHWSGGLVDLFPIEIAHALADHVVMERKRKFNPLYAQPAVRAVYGVNGNARRRAVQDNTHADVWVETTDVSRVLRHETVRKQYDRATGQIVLRAAPTHSEFVRQMTAQWHYGRERALRAFQTANKRKT